MGRRSAAAAARCEAVTASAPWRRLVLRRREAGRARRRMSPQAAMAARQRMATKRAMRGGGRNRVTAVAMPSGGGWRWRSVHARAPSSRRCGGRPRPRRRRKRGGPREVTTLLPPCPPSARQREKALLSLSQSLSLSLFLSFWLVSSRTARWRIGRRQRRGGVEAAPVERRHRRLVEAAKVETWGP